MRKISTFFSVCLLLSTLCLPDYSFAQTTFNGDNGGTVISNDPGITNPISSTATVSFGGGDVIGTDVQIDQVTMNLIHSWASDLDIVLVSPAGTRVALTTDKGDDTGTDSAVDLVFTDNSTNDVNDWDDGPPAADYRAEGSANIFPVSSLDDGPGVDLNTVFDGENATGGWVLEIFDDADGDTGMFNSFAITFSDIVLPDCAISNTVIGDVVCDGNDAVINATFDIEVGSGDYDLVNADTDEVLGSITGAATDGTGIEISGIVSGPTMAGQAVNVKVVDAQTGLPMELTTNGDFEAGDVSSWQSFPTANSTFEVTTDNPSAGTFAGRLFNPNAASAAVIKQANIGIGVVNPGDEITISFDARGQGDIGGIAFAEFFSEVDGGGTSSNVLLGGAPLGVTFNDWTPFEFTVTAGPDVSGGITLQFAAITGADAGSVMNLFIDNVSVTVDGEMCMGEPAEVTLPECMVAGCVISNTAVQIIECDRVSDEIQVEVTFDVDNGSGSYELVDPTNPDVALASLDGVETGTGLSITAIIPADIATVKIVDATLESVSELTTNGDFETGDVSAWTSFPTPNSVFEATTDNPSTGTFAGRLFNPNAASAAVIKQANIGVGVVNPGDEITISFDARGQGDNGGIAFAEFFSEVDGGGVSSAALLGGAPLGVTFNDWTPFEFTVTAGPDVSGGITLQFAAITGADAGSVMNLFIDNVSVTIESACMGEVVDVELPLECIGASVEFCVDVSCQEIGPGDEVRVFGSFEPFGSPGFFDPFLFPAFEEDPMQPGVYCGTILMEANPGLEYKFVITDDMGNVINEEQFAPDEPCTTTPFGFTNRLLAVESRQDIAVNFGWLSCDESCLQLADLPIDFEEEGTVQYSIFDFGGAVSSISPDPEDAANTVVCSEKTAGAETFAGTIVPFIGMQNPIPLTGVFPIITVDVYAPAAGISVLLKIEDWDSSNPPAAPAAVFAEVLATTTTDGWQTLVFDFNESTNMPFDENIMYDRFVIFFDFGNTGDGSSYCFDNIQICDEPLVVTCPDDVTIECDEDPAPFFEGSGEEGLEVLTFDTPTSWADGETGEVVLLPLS
ncbi:MAG: proprotein convertase P-domain-containing protein, partial [Bacteroidota bacterium]